MQHMYICLDLELARLREYYSIKIHLEFLIHAVVKYLTQIHFILRKWKQAKPLPEW